MGRSNRWVWGLAVGVLAMGLGCESEDDEPWSATGGSGGSTSGTGGSTSGTGGSTSGTGGSTSGTGGAGASGALPEGDNGIAADYANDQGIEDHPAVIFADDFESYGQPDDLWQRWDNVHHMNQIRIAGETENIYGGALALEFTVPQQNEELSNAVSKVLTQERDILFLRYHSKFAANFDVQGSSHNGSSISAHYYINGQATPGVPADGTNKFLAAYENWRGEPTTDNPGELNIYIYHPEQRSNYGDHFFPSGKVLPNSSIPHDFGSDFVERPDLIPDLDRWYAYEVMVKANTPGERDGRIACWLDGALIADFINLRLRDVDTLTIDRFSLNLHIGSNTAGETRKWYDNVVAATSYIGPVFTP
ncbi:MAG: hypothetical protein JRI68_02290 [Deltaproteobacteria bacterium]|nr:hypothetical protein [Deltaproteobacteria bacterium]